MLKKDVDLKIETTAVTNVTNFFFTGYYFSMFSLIQILFLENLGATGHKILSYK